MIPRRDGRNTGNGGGGQTWFRSVTTPFFCKRCGKTKDRKQFIEGVDVCKKCRVKK